MTEPAVSLSGWRSVQSHANEDMKGTTDRNEGWTGEPLTLNISPLLRRVWRGRWWVVASVMAGLVVGFTIWRARGVEYKAVVMLAVTPPRAAGAGEVAASTASYRALIANYSVAAGALRSAGLDRSRPPIGPEEFVARILSVEELPGTNLIRIGVRLPDARFAAMVAQDVATRAVDLARTLSQQEGSALRDRLQSQEQEAAARARAAEQRLIDFRRANQIDLLRTDVNALLKQREALPGIEVDLSGDKARATAVEKEQSARQPKDTFVRTIDESPTLMETARSQAGVDLKALLGLGLTTEEANPTYATLDRELALARARIAELEQQRQQILAASRQIESAGKISELYDKELTEVGLDADRLLARKVYDDVSQRYEQARVVVTSGSAQLQIVDPAMTLPTAVSWPLSVWLAFGGLIGAAVPIALIAVVWFGRLLAAAVSSAENV